MSRHVLSFCGCSWVMQGKCFKLFRHGRFCNCRWQSRTISFPLGSARMSKWVSNDGSTWNGDGTRYPCIGNSSRKISTLCLQQAFNSQLGPDSSPQQAFQPHNDLPKPPVRANAPDAAMHGPSSKLLPAGCQPEVQHENHGWGLKTTLKHLSVRPTMFFFFFASAFERGCPDMGEHNPTKKKCTLILPWQVPTIAQLQLT